MKTFAKMLGLLLAACFFGVVADAQTNEEVEIVGSVEEMSLDGITVNNLAIDLTSANINTDIALGTMVEVLAFLDEDSNIVALEVNAVDENFDLAELELLGQVQSVDGTVLVVGGQTVDLSNAVVGDGIRARGFVRLHAIPSDSNVWLARQAEPFIPDDSEGDGLQEGELRIVGTLEEIGLEHLGVSGQTITLNEDTEIEDTLLLGIRVSVRVRRVDGEWLALEAENAATDDDDDNDNENTNNNANDNSNSNVNDNTINTTSAVSEDDATAIVLGIYPNTSVVSIRLVEKFGGVLVWEVQTSHGIEVNIDAQSGIILTIEAAGNNNVNTNVNGNANDNTNTNVNGNDNNANINGNDNSNDNGNDNDDDEDNSGSGSGDNDDDDKSGSGSGD